MLCVFFFLCLCTRVRVEIMLQFQTVGVVSCSKMNLVGALGSAGKNQKKIKEKREFLRKTSFRPNRFFYMLLNFQKILTIFDYLSITSRNNAPISNFGDGFRYKNEYPWCIIKVK
ncbi:Uncharacterized protein FWK35_00031613, partial [Aphis craccivora]